MLVSLPRLFDYRNDFNAGPVIFEAIPSAAVERFSFGALAAAESLVGVHDIYDPDIPVFLRTPVGGHRHRGTRLPSAFCR